VAGNDDADTWAMCVMPTASVNDTLQPWAVGTPTIVGECKAKIKRRLALQF
jgi:hypothetical protein